MYLNRQNLPIFPVIDQYTPRPWDTDRLERFIERLVDIADSQLLNGAATQDDYDDWHKALSAWEERSLPYVTR